MRLDDIATPLRLFSGSRIEPEAGDRRAAVAILLREAPAGTEILFIERARRPGDPWAGQIAFPGGRAEAGESPLDAAVRETREEVDIALHGAPCLGALDELRARSRLDGREAVMPIIVSAFVFAVPPATAARATAAEVARSLWLPAADLAAPGARSTWTLDLADGPRVFSALRHGSVLIWGLTYRMLASLFRLAGRPIEPGPL